MPPLFLVDSVAVQPPLNTPTVIENNSVSGARTRKSSTGSLDTLTSIAITAAVTTTSSVKYVCVHENLVSTGADQFFAD